MRVALVGADFEENLGVGMIAAAALAAGHEVVIVAFDDPEDEASVAARVLRQRPDVVGLSVQFQHRADEFLRLARRLRREGFAGHLTCGGQFPTLADHQVLAHQPSVDSVVLHEGEHGFVELLEALGSGRSLAQVAGLALRDAQGTPTRTAGRPLCGELDALPFPHRYRAHARHCGVPFIPLMGGRGCWGACAYCSITSFYRDARAHGGGRTLRHRSPENVAAEMALLAHQAGGSAIFCFHDDNFLMPRPEASLARVRALRDALDGWDVGRVGMIGKCRPDSVTRELARGLRELGVLRLYVGVENASQQGSDHLGRRHQTRRAHEALEACHEAGIFVCYNLLLFEPQARLEDVRENVAFMRDHARHPVNFCRAEPYFGTPLQRRLSERSGLGGSYLGFNYRIEDDQTETLFRICAAAFRQRNFDPAGVANRSMGLGYSMRLLDHFYDDPSGRRPGLRGRVEQLTEAIVLETTAFLDRAVDLAANLRPRDHDRAARETATLGLAVATADRERHAALDALYADLEAFGRAATLPPARPSAPRRLLERFGSVALSASLAMVGAGSQACGGDVRAPDPPPPPLVDPPPRDHPVDMYPIAPDPLPIDMDTVVDPVPADDPVDVEPQDPDERRRRRRDLRRPPPPDPVPRHLDPVVDPPPPPIVDPAPAPGASTMGDETGRGAPRRLGIVDQWRDTTTRRAPRSSDLPLFDPPRPTLRGAWDGEVAVVTLGGLDAPRSLRWETLGALDGDGDRVRWTPRHDADSLTVAVRTAGGVAVASLRARDLET